MKGDKKLYKLAAFCIISFILLYLFSLLVDIGARHSNDEGFEKVNRIVSTHVDPDIISFGSSVGEKSFNSPYLRTALDATVYNACVDGTNFNQYKGLIQCYNSYSSRKSYVVLYLAFFEFQRLTAISSVERWVAQLNNDYVYRSLHAIDPHLIGRSRYIPLYKNTVVDHSYYKASIDGWRSMLRHQSADTMQGFVPNYSGWFPDEDAVLDAMPPTAVTIDTSVVSEYVGVIKELQQKGKHVVLVLPPAYKKFYAEKMDYGKLEQTLDSIAGITGCKFYDFLRSGISEEKHNFYNATHLCYNGSLVFCRQLADSLKALGFEPAEKK